VLQNRAQNQFKRITERTRVRRNESFIHIPEPGT